MKEADNRVGDEPVLVSDEENPKLFYFEGLTRHSEDEQWLLRVILADAARIGEAGWLGELSPVE